LEWSNQERSRGARDVDHEPRILERIVGDHGRRLCDAEEVAIRDERHESAQQHANGPRETPRHLPHTGSHHYRFSFNAHTSIRVCQWNPYDRLALRVHGKSFGEIFIDALEYKHLHSNCPHS
jgi:hypothetical protein